MSSSANGRFPANCHNQLEPCRAGAALAEQSAAVGCLCIHYSFSHCCSKPLMLKGTKSLSANLAVSSGFACCSCPYNSLSAAMQAYPHLEEAVEGHAGHLTAFPRAQALQQTVVLIVTDMSAPDLSGASPQMTQLHITTVDHLLVSEDCSDLSPCHV